MTDEIRMNLPIYLNWMLRTLILVVVILVFVPLVGPHTIWVVGVLVVVLFLWLVNALALPLNDNENPAKVSKQKWVRNFIDIRRYTVYARRWNEKHRDSDDVFLRVARENTNSTSVRGIWVETLRTYLIQRQGQGYLGRDILHSDSSFYVGIM